jgi:hypothetical protein
LDRCIEGLENELINIENGNYDHCLTFIGSYAVRPEFEEACKDILFPPLPILSDPNENTIGKISGNYSSLYI